MPNFALDHNTFVIITALALIFLLFYFIGKSSSTKTINVPYVKKTDPDAQANYNAKMQDKNLLTKEEKIELSWQFLYDITEVVLNKFSPEDKGNVHSIGHKLLDSGAGYEHVVEYGIKKEKKTSRLSPENEVDIVQKQK